MHQRCSNLFLSFSLTLVILSFGNALAQTVLTVSCLKNATPLEQLAAQELQRYLYVRTGKLPRLMVIADSDKIPKPGILVSSLATAQRTRLKTWPGLDKTLNGDAYQLLSLNTEQLLIMGATPVAVLYGTYSFLESTGIGFALHTDLIPDKPLSSVQLAKFNRTEKPAFALRGIQPFHDFPEGPDWWNEEDYKAIIGQLPKLRMNFIGFHTYPEVRPSAGFMTPQEGYRTEPLVWIGPPSDINPIDGSVKSAYPVLHFNTGDTDWGYTAQKTSDFHFGASMLFETDRYGAEYMKNLSPWPRTPAENSQTFNEVGKLLNRSLNFARSLAVKTCLGTELPLTIPYQMQDRLRALGKDPDSETTRQELYEGIFARIKATHPLDYYWLWTPEHWTWKGEGPGEAERVRKDLLLAQQALIKTQSPFTLATCGWVLGPSSNRAEFDQLLPKTVPFSVINRQVGYTPVEPSFQTIQGRPKWQISWVEDDGNMITPQFWAGRIKKDALDAYQYGCTGLMGIHWRTAGLSPTFLALSRAGWEANTYTPTGVVNGRDYTAADIYSKWATTEFGPEIGEQAARIFNDLDGVAYWRADSVIRTSKIPRTSLWVGGPGGIKPETKPWSELSGAYNFISAFEALRPRIVGEGYRERFDYWLNTFQFAKVQAQISCLVGEMQETAKHMTTMQEAAARANLARELLAQRQQAVQLWPKMVTYLLQTVSTPGELGTIANLEQHNLGTMKILTKYDSLLATFPGLIIPTLSFPKAYSGPSRLIVPTRQTLVRKGDDFRMKIRVLTSDSVQTVRLTWRPLDGKTAQTMTLPNVGRQVYQVALPTDVVSKGSFEYTIDVTTTRGKLRFPANPNQQQTVVVW